MSRACLFDHEKMRGIRERVLGENMEIKGYVVVAGDDKVVERHLMWSGSHDRASA